MIKWNDFESIVSSQLGRNISNDPNQRSAISASPNQSLFIVAGPGAGKTTVIALRVLKLIFVDDVSPDSIMVTTFTRKAASELRSRILGWGDQMKDYMVNNPNYQHIVPYLQNTDFNQIITGTIDSIAEEFLRRYRLPGTQPPVVIEDFISNAIMMHFGLFKQGRHNNQDLIGYISLLKGSSFGLNVSELSNTLRVIKDRFFHDRINVRNYRQNSSHPGCLVLCDAINDYNMELQNRLLFDFARLEDEFLRQLNNGTFQAFLSKLKFLLIDEYQDTNLLQEQIYFELAKAVQKNGGSIAVVGDDDQALYRFRGATVDLFQDFPKRVSGRISGINPITIYLNRNYRSTKDIVDFVNNYVKLDSSYQGARVANKPNIISARPRNNKCPILGMFRDRVSDLAHDLAQFIHQVIHGGGFKINNECIVKIDENNGGSPADIAVLCSSPREYNYRGAERLPLLLRNELLRLKPPIKVFNPRGQHLEKIPVVKKLCGLVLECIDPGGQIQNTMNSLPLKVIKTFNKWRSKAINFIGSNPLPHSPTLKDFVSAWQNRKPLNRKLKTAQTVSLVDLVYKLVTWIPKLQNDVEGLVYLEAITRTISDSALFSNFSAGIIFVPNNPGDSLSQASVRDALWNIFVPIASGAIDINEDLLETLPKDRINIMSIHQAKGLEFPMVIVDVGSDFKGNKISQAFRRYPYLQNGRVNGIMSVNIEDELRPYSPLGKPSRSNIDRAFDDLIRHYFVAFSRAQDVLLLVGLNSVKNTIPNIATGWDRNRTWHWGEGLPNLVHI